MEAEGVISGMLRNSQANGFWFDDASGESTRMPKGKDLRQTDREIRYISRIPLFFALKKFDFSTILLRFSTILSDWIIYG